MNHRERITQRRREIAYSEGAENADRDVMALETKGEGGRAGKVPLLHQWEADAQKNLREATTSYHDDYWRGYLARLQAHITRFRGEQL